MESLSEKKKEKIRPGDILSYESPIFFSGDKRGKRKATVLSVKRFKLHKAELANMPRGNTEASRVGAIIQKNMKKFESKVGSAAMSMMNKFSVCHSPKTKQTEKRISRDISFDASSSSSNTKHLSQESSCTEDNFVVEKKSKRGRKKSLASSAKIPKKDKSQKHKTKSHYPINRRSSSGSKRQKIST